MRNAFSSTGTTSASNIPAQLFIQTAYGELAKNGLAPLTAGFRTAIFETFMKNSTQRAIPGNTSSPTLGSLNLWIQDKLPTTSATYLEYNATTAKTGVKFNPTCTSGAGA